MMKFISTYLYEAQSHFTINMKHICKVRYLRLRDLRFGALGLDSDTYIQDMSCQNGDF